MPSGLVLLLAGICPVGAAECPQGKYLQGTQCIACPKGKFEMAVYAEHGEYREFSGTTFCYDCQPGTYSDISGHSGMCPKCPAGKFTDTAGRTSCVVCPAGQHQTLSGKKQCRSCPPGLYHPGRTSEELSMADILCRLCPPGKFQVNSPTTCQACPGGKYQPSSGAGFCANTPTPTASPTLEPTVRSEPAPTIQPTATPTAHVCNGGRVFSECGSSCTPTCEDFEPICTKQCVPRCQCLSGFVWNGQVCVQQSECKFLTCPAGKFHLDGKCMNCPRGKFQAGSDMSSCKLCQKGKFQSLEGSDYCLFCPAGKFQKFLNYPAFCFSCPKGYYQDLRGQITCSSCPAGSHVGEGQTGCIKHVGSETIILRQEVAALKKELSEPASSAPTSSPTHKRVFVAPKTTCPHGKFVASGEGPDYCIPCQGGRFQPSRITTNSSCEKCPEGKYQPHLGNSFCYVCADGKHQNEPGKEYCISDIKPTPLPLSTKPSSAPTSVPTCTPTKVPTMTCPAGKWLLSTKSKTSTFKYNAFVLSHLYIAHSSHCYLCPAGRFQSLPNQSSCQTCPKGKYQAFYGRASCAVCPLGKYQLLSGKPGCGMISGCSTGRFAVIGEQKVSCETCPPGMYQPGENQQTCLECPVGYHQLLSGQVSCTGTNAPTAIPTAVPSAAPTLIDHSPIRSIAPSHGYYDCTGSEMDYISQQIQEGVYVNRHAAAEVLGCKLPEQKESTQSQQSQSAPGTTFSPTMHPSAAPSSVPSGSPTAVPTRTPVCPIGKYKRVAQMIEFDGDENVVECVSCPIGYHQFESGQSDCIDDESCPAGQYRIDKELHSMKMHACLDCAIGKYQPKTSLSDACLWCPSGYHQDLPGQTACAESERITEP